MTTELFSLSLVVLLSFWTCISASPIDYSLVRPSVIGEKGVIPCVEDYSPCYCGDYPGFGLYVVCELVSIDNIISVFNRTNDANIFWLQLRPLPELPNRGVVLPPDLLSGKRARAIDLYCPSVVNGDLYKLSIDENALTTSYDLMEYFYILGCDLIDQTDFNFLTGFNKLTNLYMYDSRNVQSFQNLPALPNLGTLSINQCTGFELINNFPASSFSSLQQVHLTDNHLDDQLAGKILNSLISSTAINTVKVLSLAYNQLTLIPEQIPLFTQLNDLSLSGNYLPYMPSPPLDLQVSIVDRLAFTNVSLISIEPGALRGNIVYADLTRNNLTRFESNVFQSMLQGMVNLNGSLSIDGNPIECDCSLAWLIRDNRNLLPVVHGGVCSNSTQFEQLDPNGFGNCLRS